MTDSPPFDNKRKDETPLLDIQNLKTWYPIRRGVFSRTAGFVKAVDGVSLSIGRGETLGLVGESGCGKTTLGRTLLKLEKAYAGSVIFDNVDILNCHGNVMKGLRRRMQMIFQDPLSSLNPRMNILDIVTEGLKEFRLLEKDREDHARQLMNEVGLADDAIYRYPHEFSGGQCQRISIARAVSVKPEFIVCDEAVSALDVSVQAQVVNLLFDLQEKYGLSYLFISHDLSVVSHIADTIAVMYLGKIVEHGCAEEIIDRPSHPYTMALIEAVPVPGKKGQRKVLEGETPSPSAPPSGCSFHTRCPEASDICKESEPVLKPFEGVLVACHHRG